MLAVDGMPGLMYLGSQMPGIGPISLLPAYSASGSFLGYYTPIAAQKSTFTASNFNFAGNLELQAVRTPAFAMILFSGLNMNITSKTFKTPYNLYYGGKTYTGYNDSLSMSLLLTGFQEGMQVDIPLGSMIRLSPFIVMAATSGTGTTKAEPGVKTSGQQAILTTDSPARRSLPVSISSSTTSASVPWRSRASQRRPATATAICS